MEFSRITAFEFAEVFDSIAKGLLNDIRCSHFVPKVAVEMFVSHQGQEVLNLTKKFFLSMVIAAGRRGNQLANRFEFSFMHCSSRPVNREKYQTSRIQIVAKLWQELSVLDVKHRMIGIINRSTG